jgi:hypothetical protein
MSALTDLTMCVAAVFVGFDHDDVFVHPSVTARVFDVQLFEGVGVGVGGLRGVQSMPAAPVCCRCRRHVL